MASVERLYSQTFLIRFKSSASLEDRRSAVNVDVELHSHSSSRRELKIQLTDDDDLFFLYTLTLGEEDFQVLKSQQDLLVDFGAFPQKLIGLLQLCASEEEKPSPRYVLELLSPPRSSSAISSSSSSSSNSFALLKLIETNPFKNLEHLSLKLVAGTDADVKAHLASKLKALKETLSSETTSSSRRESELSERLRSTEDRLARASSRLEELTLQSQEEKTCLTSTLQRDLLAEKERVAAVRDECQRKAEVERKSLEAERQRERKELEARATNFEAANRELTDRRYANEAAVRELKAKLGSLEEDRDRASTELSNQRRANVAVDHELRAKEKEADALSHKLARCEEEIKDKEKVLQRSSELLAEERRKNDELEGKAETGVAKEKKLEKYVKSLSDEVKKGNEIIKRLQDNLKSGDAKLKLRNQIAQEQEKTLREKTDALEATTAENRRLTKELADKTDDADKWKDELEERTKDLADAKAKIDKNENLINWLNKQATEKQLHGGGGGGGVSSRLSPYQNNDNDNAGHSTAPLSNGFGVRSQSFPHHPMHPGVAVVVAPNPFGRPPTAPAALGYPSQFPATSTASSNTLGATTSTPRNAYDHHPLPHSDPPRPHPRQQRPFSTMPASAPLPMPGNVGVSGTGRPGAGGGGGVVVDSKVDTRVMTKPDDVASGGILIGDGLDSVYLQPGKNANVNNNNGPGATKSAYGLVREGATNQVAASRGMTRKPAAPSSYFPKTKLNSVG